MTRARCPSPLLLVPVAGDITVPDTHQLQHLKKAGHEPYLGNTVEWTLLTGVRISCPENESKRTEPTPHLSYGDIGKGDNLPYHQPLPPLTGWRTSSNVTRVRELALSLSSCSSQENGPCIIPGQYHRFGPGGTCMGEHALLQSHESRGASPTPCCLLHIVI